MTIERAFYASRDRVWHAFTEAEVLDQWWAPKSWKAEIVTTDFRVGGHWFYAMNDPAPSSTSGGWTTSRSSRSNVTRPRTPSATHPARLTTFIREDGCTRVVVVVIQHTSLDDLEKILAMGKQEGLTTAQDQLEALLLG